MSGTLEYPMIRGSAIHIAYRILAAFFIDMGAKTSIVENLVFIQPYIYLCFLIITSKLKFFIKKNFNLIIFSLFLVQIFVNDPSAGSPTETLLRLLLPLGDMVYLSFPNESKRFTGSPGIGRSDGRCVQRAGT